MCEQPASSTDNSEEYALLRAILEGTATETGQRFFEALVKNLCRVMKIHGAWVTEYLEDSFRLRSLAFWLGDQHVDDYEYDIRGTPCEPVIRKKGHIHIPDKVIELFPLDPDLPGLNAVSYMGQPLLDIDGRIMGHLAILDTRPMPADPSKLALFNIFAARATAELQRLRAEAQIRDREKKLSGLVDGAMDAIIELDRDLKVVVMNPAAEKAFQCDAAQMIGKKFNRLLAPDSRQKLSHLVEDFKQHPEERQSLWIADGLQAVCSTGENFPAEATLSKVKTPREVFFILILRNVNERLQAEAKIQSLNFEAEYLREEIKNLHNFDNIIGRSKPLMRVLHDVEKVARTDTTVLVCGESGTGKELIARAIHAASARRGKPLIKVNCAAIPATLIESEFFGHEKGAFTGATRGREGRFKLADGGTIFLDEIGELPLELQVKLLRVLQEGEFEPVGSSRAHKVDVRTIAATNRNLDQAVQDGDFRVDLYYRLNVFPIELPPLRDRKDDIPMLASAFADQFNRKMGRTAEPLSNDCLLRLQAYNWPGNVRELQNVIERAIITSPDGPLNLTRALPEAIDATAETSVLPRTDVIHHIQTIQELRELERSNFIRALHSTNWKVSGKEGAARLLGIKSTTLNSRLKALNIRRPH